jgi:hypothetical protein
VGEEQQRVCCRVLCHTLLSWQQHHREGCAMLHVVQLSQVEPQQHLQETTTKPLHPNAHQVTPSSGWYDPEPRSNTGHTTERHTLSRQCQLNPSSAKLPCGPT